MIINTKLENIFLQASYCSLQCHLLSVVSVLILSYFELVSYVFKMLLPCFGSYQMRMNSFPKTTLHHHLFCSGADHSLKTAWMPPSMYCSLLLCHAKLLQSYLTLCDPLDPCQAPLSVKFSRQEYWSGLPWQGSLLLFLPFKFSFCFPNTFCNFFFSFWSLHSQSCDVALLSMSVHT